MRHYRLQYAQVITMDIFALTFYGIVCGTLAYVSPTMKNKMLRLAMGVCIGLLAATALPLVRGVV
jgi:hypothetical protein